MPAPRKVISPLITASMTAVSGIATGARRWCIHVPNCDSQVAIVGFCSTVGIHEKVAPTIEPAMTNTVPEAPRTRAPQSAL